MAIEMQFNFESKAIDAVKYALIIISLKAMFI